MSLPEAWCSEAYAAKRTRCGVPPQVTLHTEPALALEMMQGVTERGHVPLHWVAADEHSGMHPALLDGIAGLNTLYVAEVPQTTGVWPAQVESIPPGPGPRGAPRTGRRVATGHHQGREHRADRRGVRHGAGDEYAWTPSRPPGVDHLPAGSGARGRDHVFRE